VLGNGAELAIAAQLASLSLRDAAGAADALVATDLLAPGEHLGFTHGLVRDAVAGEMGQHAMRAAHARAALVLRDLGAPAQTHREHLLLAPGQRDPAAAADLREAARLSMARGAATTAVTLLRRALAERPRAASTQMSCSSSGWPNSSVGHPALRSASARRSTCSTTPSRRPPPHRPRRWR